MTNLHEMTDEQLAMSYVNGCNEAFDVLLSRNQQKLFSYILFVVRDRGQAEDVFQETFVKAIVKLQQRKYAPSGKFCAWLMRIAHNIIMDAYRSQQSSKVVEVANGNDLSNLKGENHLEGNIERQYVNNQVMNDVRHLMDSLPAPQREVVFMRFYQDMSFKEIAEATNVSINTALGRMRYALLNMRRLSKRHNIALTLQ